MSKIIVKIKYFSIPIIIIIFFALLAVFSDSVVGQSPDAIAIRVLPNNEHLSALRWYKDKKFTGSPQSLLVDGYEAVRDGRTVYVSAANITANNLGDDVLYTNIYIISYNQEAENKTVDIFGKILAHWQFNSNMTVNVADIGQCSGSDAKNCWADGECPLGEFCDSRKARIVRDTKRLSDLADIKIGLNNYKAKNGKFPSLAAGSYLPNKSLSVWPSWQKDLAPALAITPLPVDPKNKLGACPGYNEITCWNENTKAFADPDPANGILDLPVGSHIYAYTADSTGQSYNICAVMESGLVVGAGSGNCSTDANVGIGDVLNNHPPVFTNSSLAGYQGRSYEGFIAAFDPDGDNLTWTLNLNSTDYTGAGWPSAPALADLGKYQRALRAGRAGNVGSYNFHLTVNDGRGGSADQNFIIRIENPPSEWLFMPNMQYIASVINPLNYQYTVPDQVSSFALTGESLGWTGNMAGSQFRLSGLINTARSLLTSTAFRYNLEIVNGQGVRRRGSFTITVINNPPIISDIPDIKVIVGRAMPAVAINASDPENNNLTYALAGSLPPGLSGRVVGGAYQITGTPTGQTPHNIDYNLTIRVTDDYHAVSSKPFKITVINHPPVVNQFSGTCPSTIRVNAPYPSACQLSAADPDGHAIARFQAVPGTFSANVTLTPNGLISGLSAEAGSYSFTVTAVDEYGAVSNPASFSLKVVDYCGDNIRQSPNLEARGGPAGNGWEDCDGQDNVAANPLASSIVNQYECSTAVCEAPPSANCPNTACSFTGGYCGDGVVQANHGENCDEGEPSACCTGCRQTCPPYNQPTILNFSSGPAVTINSGQSTPFILPACYQFDPASARVTAHFLPVYVNTAIVFVTDTSTSMSSSISGGTSPLKINLVVSALNESLQSLYDFSQTAHNISIGLVDFGAEIHTNPIVNISAASNFDNLRATISDYPNIMTGNTHAREALETANTMLNNFTAAIKIIIILSDGAPTPYCGYSSCDCTAGYNVCDQDPLRPDDANIIRNIKGLGYNLPTPVVRKEIYSIAYSTNTSIIRTMCKWSSNTSYEHSHLPIAGGDQFPAGDIYACNEADRYAFGSVDASGVYRQILRQILRVPTGTATLTVNGVSTTITPAINTPTVYNLNFSNVVCGQNDRTAQLSATYDGPAGVRLSNLQVTLCPICQP